MTNNDAPQDLATLTSALRRVTDDLVATATSEPEGSLPDPSVRERSAIRAAGAILTASDRLMAAVIGLLGRTTHRGVIAEEGVTTSTWLRVFAARTVGDERMLTATVERLSDMSAVSAWFAYGSLSWSAARGIVMATRNLAGEQRGWLDGALAADRERVCGLDADQLVAIADHLADEARPDLHSAREQRQFHGQRFSVQPRFDLIPISHGGSTTSPLTHTGSVTPPRTQRDAQQRISHRASDAPAVGDDEVGDPTTLPV